MLMFMGWLGFGYPGLAAGFLLALVLGYALGLIPRRPVAKVLEGCLRLAACLMAGLLGTIFLAPFIAFANLKGVFTGFEGPLLFAIQTLLSGASWVIVRKEEAETKP